MQFKATLFISSLLLGAMSSPLNANSKSPNSLMERTDFTCADETDGYYRDVDDCTKYYACVGGIMYIMDCPPTLYFKESIIQCTYPANVTECSTTPVQGGQ